MESRAIIEQSLVFGLVPITRWIIFKNNIPTAIENSVFLKFIIH